MTRRQVLLPLLALLIVVLAGAATAQDAGAGDPDHSSEPAVSAPVADGPVAQAVFFFSPTCGHCEYVITQVLPGLFADNGGEYAVTYDETVLPASPPYYLMSNGRLQLLMVDTSTPRGNEAFRADSERLGIEQAGVPRLDYRDEAYLVGSADIPDRLPGIVAAALAGEGLSWPRMPGLEDAIAPFVEAGSVSDSGAAGDPLAGDRRDGTSDDDLAVLPLGGDGTSWVDRFGQDVAGNGIAALVLVLASASLIVVPILAARGSLPGFAPWLVVVLAVIGMVVAAYLTTVETTGVEAVCGPVGDCNAVQQSEYARLVGIPVGVLGVVGYLALGALWVIARVSKGTLADAALVLTGVGAWLGTLFSVYLTFLEPFVIGATCMWCVSSAVVMLALLWVSAGPAHDAWERIRRQPDHPAPASA